MIINKNYLLKKHSLVISSMFVNLSLINLSMTLQIENTCQKIIISLHFVGNSLGTM